MESLRVLPATVELRSIVWQIRSKTRSQSLSSKSLSWVDLSRAYSWNERRYSRNEKEHAGGTNQSFRIERPDPVQERTYRMPSGPSSGSSRDQSQEDHSASLPDD